MTRIGKVLLLVLVATMLWVTYWLTPRMLHSQSQVVNFLQLVAMGAVLGLALVMLIGGMALGNRQAKAPPPFAPAPARAIPMQQMCEGCALYPATLYCKPKDKLLCAPCAVKPGSGFTDLLSVPQGVNLRAAVRGEQHDSQRQTS